MSTKKRSSTAVALGLLILLCAATATVVAQDARVSEVYPDPYAHDDAGEYVAVEFDSKDTTGWSLTDGEDETALPNRTLDGTVYFAREGAPPEKEDHPLGLRLANSGDEVIVRDASGEAIDKVSYGEGDLDPQEGELIVRTENGSFELRHIGSTNVESALFNASEVTAFAVPDSPEVVADEFRDADERVLVSAYTFGSGYLGDALRNTSSLRRYLG
jgi:cardiolipin synthase